MTPAEMVLAVVGALGGSGVIFAGLGAWLGKVWADSIAEHQKFVEGIDLDLRLRRIELYKELWEATAVLPKWPRAAGVTYEQLTQLSQIMRDWYFKKGGMYLSRTAHNQAYSPLQDTLKDVLSSGASGILTVPHYDLVRERCSTLRSALAADIQSRRESQI